MRNSLITLFLVGFIFFFNDCAKMGSISGGDRDSIPPVVVNTRPDNYSLRFKGKTVEITFDEFVVLKNINQELIISPPLEKAVTVKQKGKTFSIELNNELKKNTTYTLNFGQAIEDNHEGNKLSNYEFVFSTGEVLDSMAIHGRLVNAFDLIPPKEPVNIMLYDTLTDSAFITKRPLYIGKTDKEGYFRLNNLKTDTFRIYALQDLNSNYQFDLPAEKIAFMDTNLYLMPGFLPSPDSDSTIFDDLNIKGKDSLQTLSPSDSAYSIHAMDQNQRIIVDLFLFEEDHEQQFVKDASREGGKHLLLTLNKPVTDSFYIVPIEPPDTAWFLLQENADRDSFEFWITDTSVSSMDTILMEVNYTVQDSMMNFVMRTDSLYFIQKNVPEKSRRRVKEEVPDTSLQVSTIRNRAILELNGQLSIQTKFPLASIDTAFIRLFEKPDSIEFQKEFTIKKDSTKLRDIYLRSDWVEGTPYRLEMFPGALTGIYGLTNDSLNISFNIREEAYYGKLLLNVSNIQCQTIIELHDARDAIVQKKIIGEEGQVEFLFLAPAKYKLKFIHDCNKSGEWETGNYLKKLQPEKVEYYEGQIEVRSNWDVEVSYRLKDF